MNSFSGLVPHFSPEAQQAVKKAASRMEKVAEYINEMQRIYEQYGALFDQAQSLYTSLQDVRKIVKSAPDTRNLKKRSGCLNAKEML